jgi:hypothetical protein
MSNSGAKRLNEARKFVTYDAEDNFELFNSYNHELTLNHIDEFGSNALLQNLRNRCLSLSLGLRKDHYSFEVD